MEGERREKESGGRGRQGGMSGRLKSFRSERECEGVGVGVGWVGGWVGGWDVGICAGQDERERER